MSAGPPRPALLPRVLLQPLRQPRELSTALLGRQHESMLQDVGP